MQLLIEVQPTPTDPDGNILSEIVATIQDAAEAGLEVVLECKKEKAALIVHNVQRWSQR